MPRTSSGLLMYRDRDGLEVLLVHLGGPFWARKDQGAWFVPKGEIETGEDPFAAARREFEEETGFQASGPFTELGMVVHKGGKTVHAWAFRGDCDPAAIRSNTFTMEWPPRSGRRAEFPEVDRASFFSVEEALTRIHPAEADLVARLDRMWKEGLLPS